MRIEKDIAGTKEIDNNALYGINSLRAKENFPDSTPFHIEWYKSMGYVKLAVLQTVKLFKDAVNDNYPNKAKKLRLPDNTTLDALIHASKEISEGKHYEHFIVPAIQGGAGTSINMNINEILTNIALLKTGYTPGKYDIIDPIEHANIFQSTNDTVPTALTVAVMQLLNNLEHSINSMRRVMETLEKDNRDILRTGYTQLQQAVPSSFGLLFSGYNDALSRDWWRVSKSLERIKTINLGGGAIGTGVSIPRFYIMEVANQLKRITGLPITQSENMHDATANIDNYVEVHAILKSHAVNLEKIVSDLRLLSSDFHQNKELTIPALQKGSSIMPGKVNPVIPEFVISVANKIYANDTLITHLASQGQLELNAYIPTIGHALIESIKLLTACNQTIEKKLLYGIKINSSKSTENLYKNPVICTALSPAIGYNNAEKLANYMQLHNCSVFDANNELKIMDNETLKKYLSPSFLLQKGFSVKDI